uniref:LamG-like jellyroll fold domain-containing protein n=1 Tax=Vibrio sp. TaxID=678 RepID=UPI003D11AD82
LYIHYNFDDIVSNKVADKSGNGLDLTLTNAQYAEDAISGYALKPYKDQAAKLDLTTGQQIDLASTDFTLSFWLKTTMTSDKWGRYQLFPEGSYNSLFFSSANNFKVQFMTEYANGDQWVSEPDVLIPGRWQMFTYVRRQSGDVTIYVDGQLIRQEQQAAGDPITQIALENFEEAYLDELRIYKRALSGEEVSSLYINPNIGTIAEQPVEIDSNVLSGEQLWQALDCAKCHGEDGNTGSSIINALYREDIIDLIRDTMPYGNPGSCDQTCAEKLYDWMLDEFIDGSGGSSGTPPITVSGLNANISDQQAARLFYSAAHNLASRAPTSQERLTLQRDGASALPSLLDRLLNEPGFVARMAEIYQDVLHTEGTQGVLNSVEAFTIAEGGSSKWYLNAAGGNGDLQNYLWQQTVAAHKAESTELVKYVVRNDLPFSDILTADYTMVNYFNARSYGIEGRYSFAELSNPEWSQFPWDSEDYQPAQLNVPQAGVMTNPAYMTRYPTTPTNINRHRSYKFYKNFLATDILSIAGERPSADDLAGDLPTMTNPACTGCHEVMDPVASSFKHWQGNEYIADLPLTPTHRFYWPENRILPAGFNGELAPLFSGEDPLQWLMSKAVNDSRFSRSVVQTLFEPITGYPVKPKPLETASDDEKSYFASQQQDINLLAERFRQSNYNLKALVKDLVTSAYSLPDNLFGGTQHLLTPEQLDRKVRAVFGQPWAKSTSFEWLDEVGTRLMYGGLDHTSVLERTKVLSGTGATIQTWLANSLACQITPQQLAQESSERIIANGLDPEGVGIRIAPSQWQFDDGDLLSEPDQSPGYGDDYVYRFAWGDDKQVNASVTISEAGNYQLVVPYANSRNDPVVMQLYVDNQLVADNINMPNTNGWARWVTATSSSFYLTPGTYQLKMQGKGFSYVKVDSLFLRHIEATDLQFKQQIAELMYQLYGEQVEENDSQVQSAYEVYQQALALGQAAVLAEQTGLNLDGDCQVKSYRQQGVNYPYENVKDHQFTQRAWMAMMTYLLKDIRFYYH